MSTTLPTDPAQLQALLVAERAAHALTQVQRDEAKLLLQHTVLERDAAKAKLQALLKRYFGRSSEKLDPNQLALAWAAVEADKALATPPPPAPVERKPRTPSVRRAQRLEDLPVLETITLDLPETEKTAPDGTALVKIREEITDEVDYQPGKLFRRQIIRPVYASPRHVGVPQVAPLPARVIPGGQVGPGLIAHVLLSKYVDALPIYRQAAMLERLGPGFTRQAMGQWVEHGAGLLKPVYQELQKIVTLSGYVQGDETPIRVLDPARPGAARESWLWTFLAPQPKVVVFDFQLTRSHAPALAFLRSFAGIFQTDGYAGYPKALRMLPESQRQRIIHAACMAHYVATEVCESVGLFASQMSANTGHKCNLRAPVMCRRWKVCCLPFPIAAGLTLSRRRRRFDCGSVAGWEPALSWCTDGSWGYSSLTAQRSGCIRYLSSRSKERSASTDGTLGGDGRHLPMGICGVRRVARCSRMPGLCRLRG